MNSLERLQPLMNRVTFDLKETLDRAIENSKAPLTRKEIEGIIRVCLQDYHGVTIFDPQVMWGWPDEQYSAQFFLNFRSKFLVGLEVNQRPDYMAITRDVALEQ